MSFTQKKGSNSSNSNNINIINNSNSMKASNTPQITRKLGVSPLVGLRRSSSSELPGIVPLISTDDIQKEENKNKDDEGSDQSSISPTGIQIGRRRSKSLNQKGFEVGSPNQPQPHSPVSNIPPSTSSHSFIHNDDHKTKKRKDKKEKKEKTKEKEKKSRKEKKSEKSEKPPSSSSLVHH